MLEKFLFFVLAAIERPEPGQGEGYARVPGQVAELSS